MVGVSAFQPLRMQGIAEVAILRVGARWWATSGKTPEVDRN
jgi:hypothetical protein